jgi:hypothetical protein
MTNLEQEILNALNDLDHTVKSLARVNPKPSLQPLLARLDELTLKLPRDSDPNLLHYLHRKSYEKARLLLQGRDAENPRGKCRVAE